jgi:hypothetical protein
LRIDFQGPGSKQKCVWFWFGSPDFDPIGDCLDEAIDAQVAEYGQNILAGGRNTDPYPGKVEFLEQDSLLLRSKDSK